MDPSRFRGVMMEFLGILDESRKLYCRNKKLILSIMLFSLLLISLIYAINIVSVKPFLSDFLLKASLLSTTSPSTPEFSGLMFNILTDVKVFLGLEYTYIVVHSLTLLFFSIAVIHASALTHSERSVSFKGLFVLTMQSSKKALVTYLYITLIIAGYNFFAFWTLFSLALFVQNPYALRALSVVLAVLATSLQSYLAVLWILALVVSVFEENYGVEALGKAARIVRGVRLQGFLLNFLCAVLHWVLLQSIRLIDRRKPSVRLIAIGLLVIMCSLFMVNMFLLMAYTVFYFRCKKTHGEQVELVGSMQEYAKLPNDPLINEDLP